MMNPVTLTKEPITVEKRFLENANIEDIPLEENEEAATVWQFGCRTDFEFDIVDKTELGKDDKLVSIKIKNVHVTLSAPIVIWISKTAQPSTMKHEMGHVEICKRIYDNVDADAIDAGKSVIGRIYQASGATIEGAVRSAIEKAAEDAYQRYHSKTTAAVDRISTIYDELEKDKPASKETMVDEAFAKYHRSEGL